jgi:hypothetical protein
VSDLETALVSMLLAIVVITLLLVVAALIVSVVDLIRSNKYQDSTRIRVDPDRVQAHVAFPWHEDPIELDTPRRNGNGRAADDHVPGYGTRHPPALPIVTPEQRELSAHQKDDDEQAANE